MRHAIPAAASVVLLLTGLPLVAPPSPAVAQTHTLTFDAAPGANQLRQTRPLAPGPVPVAARYRYRLESRIELEVANARCGTRYHFRVDQRELPDPEPVFRGIESAEGMITGVGAAPGAKGLAEVEAVSISTRTVPQLLERLLSVSGIRQLESELRSELRQLERALQGMETDRGLYGEMICGFTPLATWACTPPLNNDLARLARDLRTNRTATLAIPGAGLANPCPDLRRQAEDVRLAQAELASFGELVKASPLAGFPAEMRQMEASLRERLDLFDAKLTNVDVAIGEAGLLIVGGREGFFAHLKRLRETYGHESVAPSALQDLAERYSARDGARLRTALTNLSTELTTLRSGVPTVPARNLTTLGLDLTTVATQVESIRTEFDDRARRANRSLADALEALETVEAAVRTTRPSGTPLGPWNANHVLNVTVLEKRTFSIPDLSPLKELEVPAGLLAGSGGAEPPAEGFTEVASDNFEVHKIIRFNVGGGIVATTLGDTDYTVRTVPLPDATGALVDQKVAVVSGADDEDMDFGLFVTYYFKELDLFPGEGALYKAWGVSLGFSLQEPSDDIYLAAAYQPLLGIQLLGGVHWGRITVLEDGIEPEVTPLAADATVAPTRQTWGDDLFFAVVFDAKVFRRLFQGTG